MIDLLHRQILYKRVSFSFIGRLLQSSAQHEESFTASERGLGKQQFGCNTLFTDGPTETLCYLSRNGGQSFKIGRQTV